MASFKWLICLVIFNQALSIVSANNRTQSCGIARNSNNVRIVGGRNAVPHQYPWLVYIEIEFQPNSLIDSCDGTLIDNQWILTAAHCFAPEPNHRQTDVSLYIGAHNLDNDRENRMVVSAQKIIRHSEFDDYDETSRYDIAMVKLPKPIDFENTKIHAAPACLPQPGEMISKSGCQSVGWGVINQYETPTSILKYVTDEMLYANECHERGVPEVDDTQVCAGYWQHGACVGDSGGPLQCQNQEGQWIVEGIVSYGDELCGTATPGVYTKVDQYLQWIDWVRSNY
ncbi:hypothetical protein RDWZM_002121 [Blomia tropicalis]|uniref:limulus clotting factor C n=1 Tax=Blomia tropicalis TaxID=40697 RepID=A0A9Q0MCW2_BLOTA|nr:hypothetical protein RDWZM_002121 [Blomia tropicalis]